MKLKQLIKKLGLPENPRKGKGDYYGYSEYWKFNDGSIVMEKDQLENLLCQQEQEWFWEEANNGSLEGWIVEQIDKASSFKDEESWLSDVLSDYQNPDDLTGEFGSLSDAVDSGIYYDTHVLVNINEWGLDAKIINIDITDYFEAYYSKSTGLFHWGYDDPKDAFLDYFEIDSQTYGDCLKIRDDLNQHLSQYAKKLQTLIESGESSATQAFELIDTLDPTNFAYLSGLDAKEIGEAMANSLKIEKALNEVEPTSKSYDVDLFDWVVSEVSSNMDWSKPFTIYQAYTDNPSRYGERTLTIYEDRINSNLCQNLVVNLDAFENIHWIESERWKKIFQMGDWFIALA